MNLCSIASGSSGNCIYVGSDHAGVLVDVGISGKKIEEGLNTIDRTTKDCDGILITHEHSDHIKGLGVISRKYKIPIYCTRAVSYTHLMALFGQYAENKFCGMNCGIMDQFTVAMGKKGHAIFLDTSDLDYKYVPIKLGNASPVSYTHLLRVL